MLSCTVQIFEIYFRPAKKIDKNSNVNFSQLQYIVEYIIKKNIL